MKWEIASVTHVGNRRTINQDRLLVRTGRLAGRPAALLAVADGMGGLAQGEKASALVVALLEEWWNGQSAPLPLEEVSRSLDAALYEAHRQIYYFASAEGRQTGSTLSLLYLQERDYLIKQIGDSRVYCLEDGHIRQLTTDQTWCNQMIQAGELTPEEASRHRLRHALVNALGVSPELDIATGQGALRHKTAYLVCSDGFYSEAPLEWLAAGLSGTPPQTLLRETLDRILDGPAADNATAVLCRVT